MHSADGGSENELQTWQPATPLPTRARSWKRHPAVVSLCVIAGLAVWVGLFLVYARGTKEAHDVFHLDDPKIQELAFVGCQDVAKAFDDASNGPKASSKAIDASIEKMLVSLEGLGAKALNKDRPAVDWIEDWRRLVAARNQFLNDRKSGSDEEFVIPQTSDFYPITKRMVDVAPAECGRAVELLLDLGTLDPTTPGS
jgi:hypothetical protein